MCVIKTQNKLLKDIMEAPYVEMLKTWLDGAPGNLL